MGGEVLYVEASLINGKGEMILTGQLGEVMQESARAALSYARANVDRLHIKDEVFDNTDVHIHVPAGAIPKDGPSAGIAMATALISALTKRPIHKDVAMTGEITPARTRFAHRRFEGESIRSHALRYSNGDHPREEQEGLGGDSQ